jgi:RecA/RadA recombinase
MNMNKEKKERKEIIKKKKDSTSPNRDQRAAALLETINKKLKGRAQIKAASEYLLPFLTKRLPTGLLSLDVELKGGFPAGGLSQVVGPKNSGKSWLAWQVIRQLQFYLGSKMKVLLAMTEMRADRGQARLAGVEISLGEEDIDKFNQARVVNGYPAYTDIEIKALKTEVGTIHELHGMSAEDLYDAVLMAVEQNAYHLIVIDSIGSIMSGAEAEAESLSEKTYGGAAAVNTQFLRKLCGLLTMDDEYGAARDVCIIAINQIRDAIGDQHKEYKSPGGRALEHAKFVDILVSSGKRLGEYVKTYSAGGTKDVWIDNGKEVNWKIEKGKAGIHEGGRGTYVFDFRTGTADFYLDTLVMGVRCGVILQAGAWLTLVDPFNPETILLKECGKDAFVNALIEDSKKKAVDNDPNSYMNQIRSFIFKKENINIDYRWDD